MKMSTGQKAFSDSPAEYLSTSYHNLSSLDSLFLFVSDAHNSPSSSSCFFFGAVPLLFSLCALFSILRNPKMAPPSSLANNEKKNIITAIQYEIGKRNLSKTHGDFHGFVLSYFIGWYYALPTRAKGGRKRYNQTSWLALRLRPSTKSTPIIARQGEKIENNKINKHDIYIIQRHESLHI